MADVTPQGLMYQFEVCYSIITSKVENITHEESLVQPPFPGNCFNWVLGHIVSSRDSVVKRLGGEKLWDEEHNKRYNFGSEPITSGDDPLVVDFAQIVADYKHQHEMLKELFGKLDPAKLDEEVREDVTLGKNLNFLAFHDAYHTGQTEYLRELVGHSDARI